MGSPRSVPSRTPSLPEENVDEFREEQARQLRLSQMVRSSLSVDGELHGVAAMVVDSEVASAPGAGTFGDIADAATVEFLEQQRLRRQRRSIDVIQTVDHDEEMGGRGEPGGVPAPHKGAAADLLQMLPPEKQLTLLFSHLSGWVPTQLHQPSAAQRLMRATRRTCTRAVGAAPADEKPERRQVLFDVSGSVRPGEVLALMGPSGSGKTTVLSVLGGRTAKALQVEGSVSVNHQKLGKPERRHIGFVLQDDVLYEDLTVYETLMFAALLRLPRAMPRAAKLERVEAVIDMLGVRKSRNTIIGGFFRRGISGGERKRVSIGHELLINPSIILLDEPTSGLDSTTALHLLQMLRELAAGGRAIATTIHQPSSRLYQQLDKLMLLAEGHAIYSGPADEVVDWLGRFGFSVPWGVSVPDFVLDVAMGEAGYTRAGNTGTAAVSELWAAWAAFEATSQMPVGGGAGGKAQQRLVIKSPDVVGGAGGKDTVRGERRTDNGGFASVPAGAASPPAIGYEAAVASPFEVMHATGSGPAGSSAERTPGPQALGGGIGGIGGGAPVVLSRKRVGASYLQQVMVLVQRAFKVRRFERLTGQQLFQLLGVAIISGLLWFQAGSAYSLAAARNLTGLLFFELLFPSFRTLYGALFTFPNEQRLLMKERPSGMYRLSAYYFARAIADAPLELLNAFLFVVVTYWLGGLRPTAGAFFGNVFALMLVVLVAEAWGLLAGSAFMDTKTAQSVTTVVMLAFLLVGGYYVTNVPVWIGWLRYLSFIYWGYNLQIKIQFAGATYYDCQGAVPSIHFSAADAVATPGCTPVPSLQSVLSLPTDPDASPWLDIVVLLGMLLLLRALVYYFLRLRTRTRVSL